MQKNWYRKMLLSYFPIFLLTITILIFLSFIIVNEISQNETVKADRISTSFTIDTVQRSLREIEMNVLEEIESNDLYNEFFNSNTEYGDRQNIYEVARSMSEITSRDALIDSIYLYRSEDRMVLTLSGLVSWEDFADKAFIEEAISNAEYHGWSNVRQYQGMRSEENNRVISLHKRGPIPFGTQGFIVINVNMYALERLIHAMNDNELSFLSIRGSDGELIFSTHSTANAEAASDKGRVLNRMKLEMLDWNFESGINAGQLFTWVSVISYVWIIIGVLTVLLATIYIIYITKRNYKPIRVLMNRVESIHLRRGDSHEQMDELSMIDQTLESLIQQMSDYEKEQKDNLLVSRRQLFLDLIQGNQQEKLEERLHKNGPLPKEMTFDRLAVIVVEIGKYSEFERGFSRRDQLALKYALSNVLQELARDEGLQGWAEWIGDNRLGIIFGLNGELASMKEHIYLFAEKGHTWVLDNLRMDLIVGVGSIEQEWMEVNRSYKSAMDALQHKLSLGKDAIIMSEDLPLETSRIWSKHLQLIADFVKEFRLSSGEWRENLERIFDGLESDVLKDEDIRMLLQMMMDMLSRELIDLSDRLQDQFKGEAYKSWKRAVEEAVHMEQVRVLFLEHLTEIYRTYVTVRETKSHHAMINEMKAYIEENFANPDLSLKHLSERFSISGKYASYLFKEEFDMNFADFLVQLRMKYAEQLLAESEETIQNIALQVGYANSITFGRMFKREVGITPGDYRKFKMKPDK